MFMSKERPKFKIGDRVETLDGVDSGTVIDVITYHDGAGSQKLRVRTDSYHETLLAIELWRKTNAHSKK
jgi:hypothetical protein